MMHDKIANAASPCTGQETPGDAGLAIEWAVSGGLVGYAKAVQAMEARVAGIAAGNRRQLIWLLEHPPLYTAGTSARSQDLLQPDRFPVHRTGRGGQYTYHGPGQRVVYVMLDLRRQGGADVRQFVQRLESWVIASLAALGVEGVARADRVGVWVQRDASGGAPREDKIAAIGIRVRKWVSYHGFSLNVDPALGHFDGIVPCGIAGYGVTSLADLGCEHDLGSVDRVLRAHFTCAFGPAALVDVAAPA